MNIKKRFNLYYWLRKIYVSKIFQSLPIKKKYIRKLVFTSIFKSKHWVQKNDSLKIINTSVSGHGSNTKTLQSKNLINCMIKFIDKFNINSILDIPCGDFLWMNQVMKIRPEIRYQGIDIVNQIIKNNKNKYIHKNIEFECEDILNFKTDKKFDLLLMRDFFIHINNSEIQIILDKIKKWNINYFASESYSVEKNFDVLTGKHRKINLKTNPFNLSNPIYSFNDFEKDKNILFFRNCI